MRVMKGGRFLIKFKKRQPNTNKGDYGKIVIVSGSYGMAGASFLCCKGAYKSGAGLVYLCIPRSIYPILGTKLTCTVVHPVDETPQGTFSQTSYNQIIKVAQRCDVIAIGPGITTHNQTKMLVKDLIRNLQIPIVIDADGLNSISDKPEILKEARSDIIITPHPGELSRLIKTSIPEIQKAREKFAKDTAKRFGVITVLKGYKTVVSDGKRVFINTTGNPGMASGGSGDVLTGMIAGLIGQGYPLFESACTGVYLHGLAGDLAAKKYGEISMIATDILEFLPEAFKVYLKGMKK
jgi:NAD(P)H-hydrate epimerase